MVVHKISFTNSQSQPVIHDVTHVFLDRPAPSDKCFELTADGKVRFKCKSSFLVSYGGVALLTDSEPDSSAWWLKLNGNTIPGSISHGHHTPQVRNGSGSKTLVIEVEVDDILELFVNNVAIKDMLVKAFGCVLTIVEL